METARKDLDNEKEKTSTQETTIMELKKDLKGFKDVDVSSMKKKIEDLEAGIRTKDTEHQKEIADEDFNALFYS